MGQGKHCFMGLWKHSPIFRGEFYKNMLTLFLIRVKIKIEQRMWSGHYRTQTAKMPIFMKQRNFKKFCFSIDIPIL